MRDTSVLVQWKPPVYAGAGPITGYFVDMAKKGSSDFVAVNAEPVGHCYLKVSHKTPHFVAKLKMPISKIRT